MYTPVNPSFTIQKWGLWGSKLYRHVFVMVSPASSQITKTRLFKYIENFTIKNENFQMKNADNFHISAQNIDGGYLLKLPR